jgi:hypothetical protein
MKRLATVGLAVFAFFGSASVYAKDEAAVLAKMLNGRTAGEPVDCIDIRKVQSIKFLNQSVVFVIKPSLTFVNSPPGGCGKAEVGLTPVTNPDNVRICNGNPIGLVDLDSGIQKGGCMLGQFVPYTKAK